MAKRAARPGAGLFRPGLHWPDHVGGSCRAVPAHVPPYRPRPSLGMAYVGRAGPTARVLGGPGHLLAH
jgi:hypothetical protein